MIVRWGEVFGADWVSKVCSRDRSLAALVHKEKMTENLHGYCNGIYVPS